MGTYACPSQSCTYSSSTAISGPGGCSSAAGWISIHTIGQTSFSYIASYLEQQILDFCAGYEGVSQTAVSISAAFSSAVARVYGSWMQYACTAPTACTSVTRSQAYNTVKGDGVAVAAAVAYAFTQASSKILSTQTDTCAAALANAFATSDAFAADTQLAVLKVPATMVTNPIAGGCNTTAIQNRIKCDFAAAFTCAVAKVLTSVSADPTPDSGSCSDNIAITGVRNQQVLVCPKMCYAGTANPLAEPVCTQDVNSGSIACTYNYYDAGTLTVGEGDQVTMLSPETTPKDPICP
eukprot:jgi/Chrzof1/13284/Cz07g27150.t1